MCDPFSLVRLPARAAHLISGAADTWQGAFNRRSRGEPDSTIANQLPDLRAIPQ